MALWRKKTLTDGEEGFWSLLPSSVFSKIGWQTATREYYQGST